jgi:predicted nuclease of predicted toxin-antitoxin system
VDLYVDAHVQTGITAALRQRGITVLTAQEDGTDAWADPDLLDRATSLGYVLFTRDADFLIEAARRQTAGIPFSGVVYAHQLHVPLRQCIDDLELIAKAFDPPDMLNRVEYLPL